VAQCTVARTLAVANASAHGRRPYRAASGRARAPGRAAKVNADRVVLGAGARGRFPASRPNPPAGRYIERNRKSERLNVSKTTKTSSTRRRGEGSHPGSSSQLKYHSHTARDDRDARAAPSMDTACPAPELSRTRNLGRHAQNLLCLIVSLIAHTGLSVMRSFWPLL
jgi:hypothetical protein